MTRRRALALTGMAAFMSACGGDSDTDSGSEGSAAGSTAGGSTATQATSQDAPQRGGILKVKGPPEPTHFDVSRDASAYVIEIGSAMYSGLLRIDAQKLPEERVITGDLAESWEVAPDGLQYTFNLRKGVTWHDGKPLTAQDVIATIERAPSVHPTRDLFGVVQSVTAPNDTTAVVKLSQPASYFPSLMAHVTSAILPAHVLTVDAESLRTKPVGTGPFKFVSWDHNVNVKLTRNEQYFLPNLPYLDGLEYTLLPDAQAEVNALRTGQIHVSGQFLGISSDDVKTLKSAVPNMQTFPTRSSVIYTYWTNNATAPFNNPLVREALSLVFDQTKIIEFGFNGNGFPCGFTLSGGLSDARRAELIPGFDGVTKDDITKAKSLMQQAGLGSGVTVDFVRGDTAAYDTHQTVVQDMVKEIGITLKPVNAKYPAELVPLVVSGKYQTAYAPWVFTLIHPTSFLSANVTGGADNRVGYSNSAYDAAYARLLSSTNETEQDQISAQMEEMLTRDRPWVPGQMFGGYIAAQPSVRGFPGVGFIRDYYDHLYTWLAG
jgi:peptide/nickel transport system substrate-binding protein